MVEPRASRGRAQAVASVLVGLVACEGGAGEAGDTVGRGVAGDAPDASTSAPVDAGDDAAPDAEAPDGGDAGAAEDAGAAGDAGTARAGVYLHVGPEELALLDEDLARPSIAVDANGRPHVVVDQNGILTPPMRVHIAHRKASGWKHALLVEACSSGCQPPAYEAARAYLGHLEIDGDGRGWVSVWLGNKGAGDAIGQAIWTIDAIASAGAATFRGIANPGAKNGNLALDPASPPRRS